MARWLEDIWLSRYLDRQLDDGEQSWFEAYMLDKPHILHLVDADSRLRDALPPTMDAGRIDIAPVEQAPLIARVPQQRSPMQLIAIAASVLFGVGLGTFVNGINSDDPIAASSPARIVFDTMRGAGAAPLAEPGMSDSKLLIVDIAITPGSRIDAARAWIGDKSSELPTPVVSSEGFVTFVVPADWRARARIELDIGDVGQVSTVAFAL